MNAQEDQEFEQFLRQKAHEAKQSLKFPATQFLRMLGTVGGYKTVLTLLSKKHPSEGFTDLLVLGRPDLTVEALVVESKWRMCFDPVLINKAENLLKSSGYSFTRFSSPTGSKSVLENPEVPGAPALISKLESSESNLKSGSAEGEESGHGALNDLEHPSEAQIPDRVARTVNVFKRNSEVRHSVLLRAEGKCEYCGTPGFELPNGSRYLEAHHIIGLAEEGPDTMHNVIALCPSHHREAHYGRNAEALEKEFVKVLARVGSEKD